MKRIYVNLGNFVVRPRQNKEIVPCTLEFKKRRAMDFEWPTYQPARRASNIVFTGGTESNLFEDPEMASSLECHICLMVAREPWDHLGPRCGVLFCGECLQNLLATTPTHCPLCRVEIESLVRPAKPQIADTIEKLRRRCAKNCGFVDRNKQVTEHEKNCTHVGPMRTGPTRESLLQLEIAELKEKLAAAPVTGVVGKSNHIKAGGPTSDKTLKLVIALNTTENLEIASESDQQVREIRTKVAQRLGRTTDSIRLLYLNHRELLDGERLRQYGLTARTQHLLVLPERKSVPPGTSLKVKILNSYQEETGQDGPRPTGNYSRSSTKFNVDRGRPNS